MTQADIVKMRLINQKLLIPDGNSPSGIVSAMCAMQSQDFGMAKWAIALRAKEPDSIVIEQEFNEGKFLRTHCLRPTWHFVSPKDIRWIVTLSAPQVHQQMAYYDRQLGLDAVAFRKSGKIFPKLLRDHKYLNRSQIQAGLDRLGLKADLRQLAHHLMYWELEGLICSGPRIGKQFTYALIDERAPGKVEISKEESISQLTERYFRSRGPATVADYCWWSGLKVNDAMTGIDSLGKKLKKIAVGSREYYFFPMTKEMEEFVSKHDKKRLVDLFLLPDYDEYGLSYKDRSAMMEGKNFIMRSIEAKPLYNHLLIAAGIVAGSWAKNQKSKNTEILTDITKKISRKSLKAAVDRYLKFHSA